LSISIALIVTQSVWINDIVYILSRDINSSGIANFAKAVVLVNLDKESILTLL